MFLVFYPVVNSLNWDRYTHDDYVDDKKFFSDLMDMEEEFHFYDLSISSDSLFSNILGFTDVYNDKYLDGGFWSVVLDITQEDIRNIIDERHNNDEVRVKGRNTLPNVIVADTLCDWLDNLSYNFTERNFGKYCKEHGFSRKYGFNIEITDQVLKDECCGLAESISPIVDNVISIFSIIIRPFGSYVKEQWNNMLYNNIVLGNGNKPFEGWCEDGDVFENYDDKPNDVFVSGCIDVMKMVAKHIDAISTILEDKKND